MAKSKRNRVTLVCNYCKKRKVKCDKGRPCGSCVIHNIPHLCTYIDDPRTESTHESIQESVNKPLHVSNSSNKVNDTNAVQSSEKTLPFTNYVPFLSSPIPGKYDQRKDIPVATVAGSPTISNKYDASEQYIGFNPVSNPFETIDFYERYSTIQFQNLTRRSNNAPFIWLSLVKKDHTLMKLWQKLLVVDEYSNESILKTESVPNPPATTTTNNSTNPTEQELEFDFKKKAHKRDGYEDLATFDNRKKSKISQDHNKDNQQLNQKMKEELSIFGLSRFDGKLDQELLLGEKIQAVLPAKKVIWMLVKRFFDKVYPYIPFFDESNLRKDFEALIGPEEFTDVKVEKVKVEKRLDFATLGILMIMLRFAYLSIFNNRSQTNESLLHSTSPDLTEEEFKYLLNRSINVVLVEMAHLCLSQFDLLRSPPLPVFQLMILTRLYYKLAPEEGDGSDGGTGPVSLGMLINMAYTMGLNLESDARGEFRDEKNRNLDRKMWYMLCIADTIHTVTYGHPPNIDPKYFDVRIPFYVDNNSNILNSDKEKAVIIQYNDFERFYPSLRSLLDLVLDRKSPANIKVLCEKLSGLEQFIQGCFGTLNDYFKPFDASVFRYPFVKTNKCRNYLDLKSFTLTIYVHLYLYYECRQKFDLAFFYARKMIYTAIVEIANGLLNLLLNMHLHFGDCAPLFLNPSVSGMIHKVSQICFMFTSRIQISLSVFEAREDHLERLKTDSNYEQKIKGLYKFSANLKKFNEICHASFKILSKRYYCAWRIMKAVQFLTKVVYNKEICKGIEDELKWGENLSMDQLNQFILLTTPKSTSKSHNISKIKSQLNNEASEKSTIKHSQNLSNLQDQSTASNSNDINNVSSVTAPPISDFNVQTINEKNPNLLHVNDFGMGIDINFPTHNNNNTNNNNNNNNNSNNNSTTHNGVGDIIGIDQFSVEQNPGSSETDEFHDTNSKSIDQLWLEIYNSSGSDALDKLLPTENFSRNINREDDTNYLSSTSNAPNTGLMGIFDIGPLDQINTLYGSSFDFSNL